MEIRPWTASDVPTGPYFHGSRLRYEPGDRLRTDVINSMDGEEDDRQRCFATVCSEHALDWANRRGIRHGGDTLYVYEVEMVDPEVDVNMHRPGTDGPISSVMAEYGYVVRIAVQLPVAEHPEQW